MKPGAEHFKELHDLHQDHRDTNDPELNLRTYRAISWIARSAQVSQEDPDTAFIHAWISFNSAYARELPRGGFSAARLEFKAFFDKVLDADPARVIDDQLWKDFEGPVRNLLETKYLFHPFWMHYNGAPGYEAWEESFRRSQYAAARAINARDTLTVLSIVFDRLYVLRNQIMHGGATWASSVNRQNVKTGVSLLLSLVPLFIASMIKSPSIAWGNAYYPVISE